MADPRDDLLAPSMRLDDVLCNAAEIAARRGFLKSAGGLLDRAAEAVAHAQQARRHRRLQRLRRAEIGQPGGDRARGEAVLDQRHNERVEHHRLLLRGEPGLELEKRHVAERHLADQVRCQVVSADEDLIGRAAAQL